MRGEDFKFCPRCATAMVDREDAGRVRRACPACDFIFYGNPTPVVAAIIELRGQVVLVRSKGWPEKLYGLVAGFLEAGETPQQGVLREVKEELGLEATIESLVGIYPFELRNEVVAVWHLEATGDIVLGDELEAFKLLPPERVRPWRLGTGLAVRDWLTARGLTPAWLGE